MTAPRTLNMVIPFEGFYSSRYSEAVDHEESSFCECEVNEREEGERQYPEALRLTESELADLLFRHTDYSIAYRKIAMEYVEAFSREASDDLGFDLRATFEAMVSPREYNFGTDRLFADVPVSVCRKLFAMSKADGHRALGAQIGERFTSRSGFISHYDNALAAWLEKPLTDWDHNELGTLLLACLDIARAGADRYGEDLDWRVYEATVGDEGAYRAWSDAVNWPAFETACDEAREDKAADLADGDPDKPGALDWRTGVVFAHPEQRPLPL